MKVSDIRQQLSLIWIAFTRYRRGFLYLYIRYVVAPRILKVGRSLESPITVPDLSMHMLFGKRDFLLALWSLASFYKVSKTIGELYLHSDGTLSQKEITVLKTLFPAAYFIDAREVVKNNITFFDTHPDIKEFRATYTKFQAKKLLDPFLSSSKKYRLVLDSDMLWFKDPTEFRDALVKGVPEPLMMSNAETPVFVTFKDGSSISRELARFNSGIVLYRSDQYSIDRLKEFLSRIDWKGSRFTDQACIAYILTNPILLPEETYIIKGELTDRIVMRHYTNPSRGKFFCLGLNLIWKGLLKPYVRN